MLRPSTPADLTAIERLYRDAFPQEDLVPLVRSLLALAPVTLSLVASGPDGIAGHVVFTRARVEGSPASVALLGPLAVATSSQRRGIGTLLVKEGIHRLAGEGVARVLVLGDPAYYGRFGFRTEAGIRPPYVLPAEWMPAWQSLGLEAGGAPCRGTLVLPSAWLVPSLWAP